jgi:uncharacterized protein
MAGELDIIVKTTDACNASCIYCSAGSSAAGRERLSPQGARLLCNQAAELVQAGKFERVRLLWHGGEPLLLGKAFFKNLAEHGIRNELRHGIQTNLTLLDREWIEILQPLVGTDGIGTSVDPFDDVRRLGHKGEYTRRWLNAVELLDEVGWRIGCVYVVHRRGLARARETYWFFRNLRDSSTLSLRVNPLLRVGRAEHADCTDLALAEGEFGTFLTKLGRIWLDDQRRLILSPINDLVSAWQGHGHVRSCDLAGARGCVEAHLGIDPAGNIYNCGRAVDADGMRFGNLQDVTLAACLEHPSRETLRVREETLLGGRCGDCRYWELCHGGCPYEAHRISEQRPAPTALCEDFRRFFRWLEGELGPIGTSDDSATDATSLSSGPVHRSSVFRPRSGKTPSQRVRQHDMDAVRIWARSHDDLQRAIELCQTGQNVALEMPTSLYRAYATLAGTGRRPAVDRILVDEPPAEIDRRLIAFVASTRQPVWVGPDGPGGGMQAARELGTLGVPVVIDRPKEWRTDDLRALALACAHSPGLTTVIDPFHATFQHLCPGGPSFSLGTLYESRPIATEHVDAPAPRPGTRQCVCAAFSAKSPMHDDATAKRLSAAGAQPTGTTYGCCVCEAFKSCRGFWLQSPARPEHCECWREIVNMFVGTARSVSRAATAPPAL